MIFAILARFWEALEPPKINKKLKKSCSGRFWNAFRIFVYFWVGFGRVWGGFGEGFGRIFEIFWKEFQRNLGGQTLKNLL